jgi:hypothetical protein
MLRSLSSLLLAMTARAYLDAEIEKYPPCDGLMVNNKSTEAKQPAGQWREVKI